MKAPIDYTLMDSIYSCLEKEAITKEYTNNSHGFCFADFSYAFVYFGYTYISITLYSANHDVISYFYTQE